MTKVWRLLVVSAVLGLTASFSFSHVRGEAGNKVPERVIATGSQSADTPDRLAEDLAQSKFANGGVVTYRTSKGDTLFALAVKPRLDAVPARPRDYLILVDDSASQVGVPWQMTQDVVQEVIT